MKAAVYDTKGKEVRSIDLPERVFGSPKRDALVYQVVIAMEANARTRVAHVKGRGEVAGGGKKPWKQKGTGRARHGSIRSPIWRGGGVTHGPSDDRDYSKKVNKKMRAQALAAVLSRKLHDTQVLFADLPAFAEPKTKSAKGLLMGLSGISGFAELATRRRNAVLIAAPADARMRKSFSNMGNVHLVEPRNLNPVDVLAYRYLVIADPEATVKTFLERMK